MTLNLATVGWDLSQYAQHQVQISELANTETATLQTQAPSASSSNWVDVQQVVGDSDGTNHMIVLSPQSGRHAAVRITFSNGSGSAEVAIGSHISADRYFGV